MRSSSTFLSLSFALSVVAIPAPPSISNVVTAAECKVVDVVVDILKLFPTATPWCSSFLGIQTSTSTVTSTVTVHTSTTYSTITGTNTLTEATVTVSSTTTTTVTTCLPASLVNKRDIGKRGKITPTSSTTVKTTSTPSPSCTIPAALAAFQSAAISTACECLSIKTPTITVTASATATSTLISTTELAASTTVTPISIFISTVTSTEIACPTPDTSCGNAGVQYAVWYNSQAQRENAYPNFDPTLYKSDTAEFTGNGSTESIGPIDTGSCSPYVSEPVCTPGYVYSTYTSSLGLVTVDHRGYLFAPLDGDYTITINGNDNIVLVWISNLAYSSWTRENADMEAGYPNPPSSSTVTLSAGQWFPIRVMYANGGGPGSFSIRITAPDGTEIAGSDETSSPFLVQYSCDGTYPQYPAWNSET